MDRTLAAATLAFLLLSACAHNPFPSNATEFVQPGKTTRAEIIENFSTPSLEMTNPPVIVFTREKTRGREPDSLYDNRGNPTMDRGMRESSGHEISILCFLLDSQNRVVRFENLLVDGKKPIADSVREWALKGK